MEYVKEWSTDYLESQKYVHEQRVVKFSKYLTALEIVTTIAGFFIFFSVAGALREGIQNHEALGLLAGIVIFNKSNKIVQTCKDSRFLLSYIKMELRDRELQVAS